MLYEWMESRRETPNFNIRAASVKNTVANKENLD